MSLCNTIQWYENKMLDKPELRSPTPCPRGVYCQYKLANPETKEMELACCRMVHPGEEGNGRRLFPARTAADGRQQPACVRLTGKAGFYERCRLKQPWRVWATEHGISLPPTDVPWIQVVRGPIRRSAQQGVEKPTRVAAVASGSAAPTTVTEWPCLENSAGRLPFPPPPLNFFGVRSATYGFSAADNYRTDDIFPMPPQIVRLRSERLYEEDEETGSLEECSIPPIYISANSALCAEGAMDAVD